MDLGYIDQNGLFKIHEHGAYFVNRSKENINYQRLYSNDNG